MTTLGYVITALLWAVVLIPLGKALWSVMRTTRPRDLKPRVKVVRRGGRPRYNLIVSRQRAAMEPHAFEQITPWSYRRRQQV